MKVRFPFFDSLVAWRESVSPPPPFFFPCHLALQGSHSDLDIHHARLFALIQYLLQALEARPGSTSLSKEALRKLLNDVQDGRVSLSKLNKFNVNMALASRSRY